MKIWLLKKLSLLSTLIELVSRFLKLLRNIFSGFSKLLRRTLHPSKQTVIVILSVVTVTLVIAIIISMWSTRINSVYIPSISNIRTTGVKAFWDTNISNEIEEIRWGTIYAGESKKVSIYLKSVSNVEITLEMKATHWTFRRSDNSIVQGPSEVSPYLNLMWDYNNMELAPGEDMHVTLTLSTDGSSTFIQFLTENEVEQFSFDITIRAVE